MPRAHNSVIAFKNKKFEYCLMGSSGSTLIFLNGFRMSLNTWSKVYPIIAQHQRVLLFNRAGIGKSSKAQRVQDGKEVVGDLCELLDRLQLKPPYILVAHSLGGIYANLFARNYSQDIEGVVFVDSAHPLEIAAQKQYQPPFILNRINSALKTLEKYFDTYKYSEDESIDQTISQIALAKEFPHVPVAVVTGTKKMPFVPAAAFGLHQKFQKELGKLSPLSKQYFCDGSGHFPQITEHLKVIEAISAIIDASKTPSQKPL